MRIRISIITLLCFLCVSCRNILEEYDVHKEDFKNMSIAFSNQNTIDCIRIDKGFTSKRIIIIQSYYENKKIKAPNHISFPVPKSEMLESNLKAEYSELSLGEFLNEIGLKMATFEYFYEFLRKNNYLGIEKQKGTSCICFDANLKEQIFYCNSGQPPYNKKQMQLLESGWWYYKR